MRGWRRILAAPVQPDPAARHPGMGRVAFMKVHYSSRARRITPPLVEAAILSSLCDVAAGDPLVNEVGLTLHKRGLLTAFLKPGFGGCQETRLDTVEKFVLGSTAALMVPDAVSADDLYRLIDEHVPKRAIEPNQDWTGDAFQTWDAIIQAGKSYLVGDEISTQSFIASHRRTMGPWHRLAYWWAMKSPERRLRVTTKTQEWRVFRRGEYVSLDLPYHGRGGEKQYVSRNGISMIKIGQD